MKKIIIIYGPTAVGKSDFGEQLARHIQGEIINGDVGQFYTPLTIGTAKPDWQNSDIPHHLFDIIDAPKNLTVSEYRAKIQSLIEEIFSSNRTPIIIGGSGFYIKSLFFPPQAASIESKTHHYELPENRWQQLFKLDPDRAQNIHPHDFYRINRALDIFFETGKKASDYKPFYQPIAPFIFVNLTRDRADLYNRINERTQIMLTHGWIDEVKQLVDTSWEPFLQEKKLIGYDDIIQYLKEMPVDIDVQNLTDLIAQKTRNYAKRQICFSKMLLRELEKYTTSMNHAQGVIENINLQDADYKEQLDKISVLMRS